MLYIIIDDVPSHQVRHLTDKAPLRLQAMVLYGDVDANIVKRRFFGFLH